jgi:predicted nuclease of predicted toxin-antitoxin system
MMPFASAAIPPGLPDAEVLAIARRDGRILLTNDRDFSELIFAQRREHGGVISLRLRYSDRALTQRRLTDVLTRYSDQLHQFLAVTRARIRVRR